MILFSKIQTQIAHPAHPLLLIITLQHRLVSPNGSFNDLSVSIIESFDCTSYLPGVVSLNFDPGSSFTTSRDFSWSDYFNFFFSYRLKFTKLSEIITTLLLSLCD